LRIERITFQGSTASAEAWYSGLALAWLLMIGAILLHRRRETAQWRGRLFDSMRTIVDTIPHIVWSLDQDGKATSIAAGTNSPARLGAPTAVRSACAGSSIATIFGLRSRNGIAASGRGANSTCSSAYGIVRATIDGFSREPCPLATKTGQTDGWYGTCTDVHDRVLAQHALRNSVENERKRSRQLKWDE
jgi:MYXO-CTERM domain-containing protein